MTARSLSSVVGLTVIAFALAGSAGATTPGPNGRIAFSSTRESSNNQLYSAAPDGTDIKRLSWTSVIEQAPAWSPDGTRIAYEGGNGPFRIWVMNSDGSGQTQVTPGTDSSGPVDMEPTWSPDGRQLAFTSTRGSTGGWHIWVVNADGTNLHQITTTNDQTESPAWSPDGTRIAYVSASTGALFVANADGSGARQLTTPPASWYDEHPDWSPDGSTIVFSRRDFSPTATGLYTISADGTNERQFPATPDRASSPSYSPDGTKIVFQANSGLYTMNSNGSGVSALPVGGIQPAWGTSTTSPNVSPPDAPRVQILSPLDGAVLFPGQHVPAWYTCDSFVSFVVSCVGSTPLGVLLDTSSSGTKQLTVTATDAQGKQATASVTYTVLDFTAPRIDLRTPQNGAEYEVGTRVSVDYSCSDPGGSGVDVCLATLPVGFPLDTSRLGTFTFRVDALDRARNYSSVVATYRVVDHTPPTVKITAATDRTEYTLGSTVLPPVYSCADSGSGVASCQASPIDTATVGAKTFTVTATDNAGNSATASLSYSVVYAFGGFQPPTAAYPGANSARPGDAVHLRFSLSGDHGLAVVTSATWTGCGDGSSASAKTTLSYKSSSDAYDLKAFTADSWSGSCKDLVVTLDDGTTHRARFAFSR